MNSAAIRATEETEPGLTWPMPFTRYRMECPPMKLRRRSARGIFRTREPKSGKQITWNELSRKRSRQPKEATNADEAAGELCRRTRRHRQTKQNQAGTPFICRCKARAAWVNRLSLVSWRNISWRVEKQFGASIPTP